MDLNKKENDDYIRKSYFQNRALQNMTNILGHHDLDQLVKNDTILNRMHLLNNKID